MKTLFIASYFLLFIHTKFPILGNFSTGQWPEFVDLMKSAINLIFTYQAKNLQLANMPLKRKE